jgi:hypothetical protein
MGNCKDCQYWMSNFTNKEMGFCVENNGSFVQIGKEKFYAPTEITAINFDRGVKRIGLIGQVKGMLTDKDWGCVNFAEKVKKEEVVE